MSLKEFGEGHKGAGSTPVSGDSAASETAPSSTPSISELYQKLKEKSDDSRFDVSPTIPGAKMGLRLQSSVGIPAGAKLPEEFDNTARGRNAKSIFKLKGGMVIGETHDVHGNPLSDPLLEAASEKTTVNPEAKAAPAGSEAESAYEDKLRKRMPFPGAANATKGQRAILTSTGTNLRLLTDHWNRINDDIGDNTSHPLYETHKSIGGMLALAHFSLDAANKSKAANTSPQMTAAHMRAATDALHSANDEMHRSSYYTQAGVLPPVGTHATDVDRAHSLVEHPVAKDTGNLPKYIKLGRGGDSKIENTQATFERLKQMQREMADPELSKKYAGINRGLFSKVLGFATKGTPKGGAEYGETNRGPVSVGDNDMGSAFNTVGFAGARPTSLGAGITPGSSDNLVKSKKVNFVFVHPNAVPVNAKIAQHKVTGQRWAFVDGKPVDSLPKESEKKLVPFGKHIGMKVIDANGREVPHLDDKGRPLSFKELVRAGALHTTVQDVNPAPRSKSAPEEKPEPVPAERNWDTLPKKQRAAITKRKEDAVQDVNAQIADIDDQISDRQKLVDHVWEQHQAEQAAKEEAKKAKPTTTKPSRKKKTDAEIVAEAALLGIKRRGAK